MPQIGQLRQGLWVASGFGRHGLNTSAMAGQLIARSILWGDERWRLFSPFELVWAGGRDRPRRRPSDRDVGPGRLRRGGRARPLSGRRAGRGTCSRGTAGESQSPGRHQTAAAPPPPPGGPHPVRSAAAGIQRAGTGRGPRASPRRKVSRLRTDRCNFRPGVPYLIASNRSPLRTETMMIDRRILLRIRRRPVRPCRLPLAARLAGAGRREIRDRKDRCRMARAADAAAI